MFLGAIPNELWAIYQHNIIIMEYNYITTSVRVPPIINAMFEEENP